MKFDRYLVDWVLGLDWQVLEDFGGLGAGNGKDGYKDETFNEAVTKGTELMHQWSMDPIRADLSYMAVGRQATVEQHVVFEKKPTIIHSKSPHRCIAIYVGMGGEPEGIAQEGCKVNLPHTFVHTLPNQDTQSGVATIQIS